MRFITTKLLSPGFDEASKPEKMENPRSPCSEGFHTLSLFSQPISRRFQPTSHSPGEDPEGMVWNLCP
jgi:hypothetical protein